ncbi:MAG: hypothetical protein HC880_22410 [Bacteroidia bacterium]|nr:hypothetical protein [Bacteroidia bacterium]
MVSRDDELKAILELQKVNLRSALSSEQQARQGFLTVGHDLELLRQMNAAAPPWRPGQAPNWRAIV